MSEMEETKSDYQLKVDPNTPLNMLPGLSELDSMTFVALERLGVKTAKAIKGYDPVRLARYGRGIGVIRMTQYASWRDKWTLEMNEKKTGIGFPGDLRDWFAGQALAGILAEPCDSSAFEVNAHEMAGFAYKYADAMIEERKESS